MVVTILVFQEGCMQQAKICYDSINNFVFTLNNWKYINRVSVFLTPLYKLTSIWFGPLDDPFYSAESMGYTLSYPEKIR